MRKFYSIYDLDGTIADDRHRLSLIKKDLPNSAAGKFAAYHAHLGDDKPFESLLNFLIKDLKNPNCIVEIWTARPEMTKDFTFKWLRKHIKVKIGGRIMWPDVKIRFRGDDDHRSSVDLKSQWLSELYEECTKGSDQITSIIFYDDRLDVLQGYQKVKNHGQGVIRVSCNLCQDGNVVSRLSEVPEINFPKSPVYSEHCRCVAVDPKPDTPQSAADILAAMADTFRERNAVYKDNYKTVGKVMAALFPNGIELNTEADHNFYHLFELAIVKLTRFTNSGLRHKDSIHDIAVYSAMLELLVNDHQINIK